MTENTQNTTEYTLTTDDRYEYMNEKHAALVAWENMVTDTQKVDAS